MTDCIYSKKKGCRFALIVDAIEFLTYASDVMVDQPGCDTDWALLRSDCTKASEYLSTVPEAQRADFDLDDVPLAIDDVICHALALYADKLQHDYDILNTIIHGKQAVLATMTRGGEA